MTAPTIRPVATADELAAAFDVAAAQFADPVTRVDRRCRELLHRFPADQRLMLVAEQAGRIVGAALGFRKGDGVTLRVIGLEPVARGRGIYAWARRRSASGPTTGWSASTAASATPAVGP